MARPFSFGTHGADLLFPRRAGTAIGQTVSKNRRIDPTTGPHEMAMLSIDPGLAGTVLPWHPRLNSEAMLQLTADWYAAQAAGQDIAALTDAQIAQYQDLAR